MTDLLPFSGMQAHFSHRMKQYLLFLEVANDIQLIHTIVEYLDIKDLLNFLSTSSHLYNYKDLQSIEVRILRAKLYLYQAPKLNEGFKPFMLYTFNKLPQKIEMKPKKMEKMIKEFSTLKKLNEQRRIFKALKNQGITNNKESSQKSFLKQEKTDFSKYYDLFQKQDLAKEQISKNQAMQWSDIKKKEVSFIQRYREHLYKQKLSQLEMNKTNENKKLIEYNPYISRLQDLQHQHARLDYQKRRMKKVKQANFMTLQQLKKMAETDPCSRQIYNKLYEQEKAKIQRENVAKLTMKSTPRLQEFDLDRLQTTKVKVVKQSIAGKVYSGIKNLVETILLPHDFQY